MSDPRLSCLVAFFSYLTTQMLSNADASTFYEFLVFVNRCFDLFWWMELHGAAIENYNIRRILLHLQSGDLAGQEAGIIAWARIFCVRLRIDDIAIYKITEKGIF